ncbi:MAG: alkaline phosphatase PhoX [Devosia sp.]
MKSVLLATTALVAFSTAALAAEPFVITSVPLMPAADVLSPGLTEKAVATGGMKLENPSKLIGYYGYGLDGPLVPVKGAVPAKGTLIEATKTEPDKNTYLVLTGQTGAVKGYNYGTHFLFQGHEGGPADANGVRLGELTRINLDASEKHRVTLMAAATTDGTPLPLIDGSAYDPFAKVLLLTSETGPMGGVWQATLDYPSKVVDLSGATGRASYEGVQFDSDGSVWLVEDAGGSGGSSTKAAKQPNSFVYRFIPKVVSDLTKGGTLQVLQVLDQYAQPIVFHDKKQNDDILAPIQKLIYGYNYELSARWVTIHDTDKDGMEPFDANVAAKAASGTPFKRPENGQFRPGTSFKEFYFSATGDTNIKTEAGQEYGGFGAILRLTQKKPGANTGRISTILRGDAAHTGFDNLSFLDGNNLLVGEDAGDSLHRQRNLLDSLYMVDVTADYSAGANPVRVLAQGRDEMAVIDGGFLGKDGFQNEGDNEITGIHVSDGDATVEGLIGTRVPTPWDGVWRVFYTRQHGTNTTFEIVRAK